MMKRWSLIALVGALLGAVSCTPIGGTLQGTNSTAGVNQPGLNNVNEGGALPGSAGSGPRATSGDLRALREQRAALGREQVINSGRASSGISDVGSSGPNVDETFDAADLPPLPPLNIDYRYALPVPGRTGWVLNPYTNRPIDVRGVESGRLIYDERDPENRNEDGTLKEVADMPNKFRVP